MHLNKNEAKKILKKNQNSRLKKTEIFKTANSQNIFAKIKGLVLGLLLSIDAKGIDVAQPIWLSDCPTRFLSVVIYIYYIIQNKVKLIDQEALFMNDPCQYQNKHNSSKGIR